MIEGGFRDRAHQADRAAAVDQAHVVVGKGLAECDGSFNEAGIVTGAGAAINTDSLDLVHTILVALQRKQGQDSHMGIEGQNIPQIPANREQFSS